MNDVLEDLLSLLKTNFTAVGFTLKQAADEIVFLRKQREDIRAELAASREKERITFNAERQLRIELAAIHTCEPGESQPERPGEPTDYCGALRRMREAEADLAAALLRVEQKDTVKNLVLIQHERDRLRVELAAAREELRLARAEFAAAYSVHGRTTAELAAAREELNELRADKVRIDWMVLKCCDAERALRKYSLTQSRDVRAALDAAMESKS